MNDHELLQLLQNKSPDELSPQEIQLLRARLRESDHLRAALLQDLRLEAHLAAALGGVNLQAEEIVARAEQRRRASSHPLRWIMAISLVLGALAMYAAFTGLDLSHLKLRPTAAIPESEPKPEEKPVEQPAPIEEHKPMPESEPKEEPPVTPIHEKPPVEKVEPPPANVEAVKPAPPAKPWDAIMRLPVDELPTFAESCYREFPSLSVLPLKKDLEPWFTAVPGKPFKVHEIEINKRKYAALEGIARLAAPLPADGGLRFAMTNSTALQIHAYHGNQGATLYYHRADSRDNWEAYATTRNPDTYTPQTLIHTASDDGRAIRLEIRYGGPLELRWAAGELALWRGGIAVIRTPLPQPPDEIYFEGNLAFEGIELNRTQDVPPAPPKLASGAKLRPAELPWTEKLTDNAKFERLPDGSVRLSSQDTKERSIVLTPFSGYGPREVIFEIDPLSNGFGICFGYENGDVHNTARLIRNKKTGRVNFVLRPADNAPDADTLGNYPEKQECITGDKLFIKLLFTAWGLVAWQSVDGEHWANADRTEVGAPPGVTSVGLYLCKLSEAGGGTVKSITIREFPTIASLVPRAMLEAAPSFNNDPNYFHWLTRATETCPVGTDLSQWRLACAIKSFGNGCLNYLADPLLEAIVNSPEAQVLPFEKQLALLQECLQLTPSWTNGSLIRLGLLPRLHRAAELASRSKPSDEARRPFSLVLQALLETPYVTRGNPNIKETDNIERELLSLLYSGNNLDLLDFSNMLRFYHFETNHPLLPWAEMIARRNAGLGLGERKLSRDRRGKTLLTRSKKDSILKADWQELFVEELDKEVYNFATDLEALIESDALADAGRMITSLSGDRMGLTPIAEDRELFVSLRSAARLALARHPKLQEEVNRTAGSLAQLRVRQAISANDAAALELATVQFAGSESATEAHAWLGDRALQLGWFTRALAEYRQAVISATPAQLRAIQPRVRLAAAMLGSDDGSNAEQVVFLGDARIAPQEFESLVKEMRERAKTSETVSSSSASSNLPVPSRFELARKARLDGPVGQKTDEEGARFIHPWKIDYIARQIATEVVGETIYVNNRFQIAAYNKGDCRRLWTSKTPAGDQRRTQDWPLVPMRPVITEQRIFARQLYGPLPTLCCFQKTTGDLLWQQTANDREGFVSDPFFSQGELLVLGCQRMDTQWELQLLHLDPNSGDVLSRHKLVSLRKHWELRRSCEILPLADSFIAVTGGLAIHSDLQGNLRWVRKSLYTPNEERPEWVRQHYAQPLLHDQQVVILQPGTEAIECVDLKSGQRIWSYNETHPWRILGRSGELLIAETAEGFVALDLATGKVRWQVEESSPRLNAATMSEKTLLYTIRHEQPDQPATPVCVWLDVATGKTLARSPLPELKHADPRLGPFVVTKDRLWTFSGNEKDPNRDLVDLQIREPLNLATREWNRDAWCFRMPKSLAQALHEKAPDWQLLSTFSSEKPIAATEWQGEKEVFGMFARPDLPVALAYTFNQPLPPNTHIQLRLGHEPGEEGEFKVYFGTEAIITQIWKPDTQKERWMNLEVDLSPQAGKTGTIMVKYKPVQGNDHTLWIKSIRQESK